MTKVFAACAAALMVIAAGIDTASAQRGGGMGGGGAFSGGGGRAFVGGGGRGFTGSGLAPRFHGGGGLVASGPRGVRVAATGPRLVAPGFHTGRVVIVPRRLVHHRRFVHHGFVGLPYVANNGCYRWQWVATPVGLQWRPVNVCRFPYQHHFVGTPYHLYY